MYTFHNLKQTRLSQVSSGENKESECLTSAENTFPVLWSVYWPPLLPSNYHFFPLNQAIGGQLPSPVPPPESRAGTAILQITILWAHLLSEWTKQRTHTPALHPLVFFLLGSALSFETGKSAFPSAPQRLQLFRNSWDKAPGLLPQLKPLPPPLVKRTLRISLSLSAGWSKGSAVPVR